jgi:hypothetical protein
MLFLHCGCGHNRWRYVHGHRFSVVLTAVSHEHNTIRSSVACRANEAMMLEARGSIQDYAREDQLKLARVTTHVSCSPSVSCPSKHPFWAPPLPALAGNFVLLPYSSPALAAVSSCLVLIGWEASVPGPSGVIRLCASPRFLELFVSFCGVSRTWGCGFAHRGRTPSTLFAAEQQPSAAPAAATATALARTLVLAFMNDKRTPGYPPVKPQNHSASPMRMW